MGRRKNNNHKISVILPIYNEPQIFQNLKILEKELARSFRNYEIVCVNDGSLDGTLSRLNRYNSHKLKLITYPLNIGKGFALCYGFTQSTGDIVAFLDSDLDLHPRQLRLFADLMGLVNADIVIGSKRHPLSQVDYPLKRRIYSRAYQILVRLLFGLNVTDTQVGMKLFKRKVLKEVIPRIAVKSWAFDLEVLVVAKKLGYNRIIEAPIEMKARFSGSKINLNAVRKIIWETMAIFYRRYLLRFYHRRLTKADLARYLPKKSKR